jgi:integrase
MRPTVVVGLDAGANVKAVQKMLGHASAAMTLDTYADLFDRDAEAVADARDERLSGSLAAVLRRM